MRQNCSSVCNNDDEKWRFSPGNPCNSLYSLSDQTNDLLLGWEEASPLLASLQSRRRGGSWYFSTYDLIDFDSSISPNDRREDEERQVAK